MAEQDYVDQFREVRVPFDGLIGLVLDSVTLEAVSGSLVLDPERHMQPYGIVHGGVYAAIGESLASMGAALWAARDGRQAVGLENHTSFIRATRGGTLHATARPLQHGRTVHLWEVLIEDDDDRLVAKTTVRLALPEARH